MTKRAIISAFAGILIPATLAACAQFIGIEDLPPLDDVADAAAADEDAQTNEDAQTCIDLVPTIHFLIDHSGSMNLTYAPAGEPRIDVVREALLNATTGIIPRLSERARIGATLYTSFNGNENPPCPRLTSIAPALNNFDAINESFYPLLNITELGEDHGTAESLEELAASFPPRQGNDLPIIVLATDVLHDTCDIPNPETPADEEAVRQRVEQAVQRVFNDYGIRVLILSLGTDNDLPYLYRLANAGVGKPFDDSEVAPLYHGSTPGLLYQDVNELIEAGRCPDAQSH